MAKTERSGHTTTDHDFIRQWVEERGGWPARVKGTESGDDAGLIRVDFPGYSGEGLEKIDWDAWFRAFDSRGLAFLHRDLKHAGNDLDRFNKLVRDEPRGRSSARGGTRARKSTAERSTESGKRVTRSGSGSTRKSASTASSSTSGKSSSGTGKSSSAATRKSSSTAAGKSSSTAAKKSGSRTRKPSSEEMTELRELLMHELGDLLYAERRFVTSTRTMSREAQAPRVKARLEAHAEETEGQIERLKAAFEALGEKPRAVKCEAAIGLREEHDSFKSEEKPSTRVLSAFDLGSGLRVEHYEIAGYKSAIALAGALGEKECAAILRENLKEEVAMASFLEKNAPLALRRIVAQEKAGEAGSMFRAIRNAVGV
jgi:ferritin-like metal-binding protein YciE